MNKITSFRLPCIPNLIKCLGKVDATVECTELAIREFINECKNDPDTICEYSKRHNIKVDYVNLDHLQVRTAQLYLISVYQQAEGFLENFRDEHPLAKKWRYDDDDDLLRRILKNIGSTYQQTQNIVGILEVDLFDYYRHIRNCYMHPEIDKTTHDKKTEKLKELVKHNQNYARLNAPNIYDEISFDDFILFTRIIKHIAYALCKVNRPTDQEIADILIKKIRTDQTSMKLQTIKRLKNNPKRAHSVLTSYLGELYGLVKEEAEPIACIIQSDLLA